MCKVRRLAEDVFVSCEETLCWADHYRDDGGVERTKTCKQPLSIVGGGTYGEVGVYGPCGLLCDEGEACDAACAMTLLALLRSLNDLCFLLLVDLPAR